MMMMMMMMTMVKKCAFFFVHGLARLEKFLCLEWSGITQPITDDVNIICDLRLSLNVHNASEINKFGGITVQCITSYLYKSAKICNKHRPRPTCVALSTKIIVFSYSAIQPQVCY